MTERGIKNISIPRLRRIVLGVLVVAVVVFTAAMFLLVNGIFDNFGPAAQRDLEWKTERGARELATSADLGIAIADEAEIRKAFADYEKSEDVVAIIAVDSDGKSIARYGTSPEADGVLFSGAAGMVRATKDYLVSWTPAIIEGAEVGRVALVVSTGRLHEARELLWRVRFATGIAGLLALVLGTLVLNRFTGAVADRDAQLEEYAHNLERKVEERTKALDMRNRGMRRVLDNVEQGFITVGIDGRMASERSAIVDRWFSAPDENMSFVDFLGRADEHAAVQFDIGLDQLRDDILPLELLLDQMPKRMTLSDKTLSLGYTAILEEGRLEGLLVVLTDVSATVERERMEREQRELLSLFERMSVDRAGFIEFVTEADEIVRGLLEDDERIEVEKRLVHTLKGNAGVFGLASVAELCHDIETGMAEEARALDDRDRALLRTAWAGVRKKVQMLLGDNSRRVIEVAETEYLFALSRAQRGASAQELAALLDGWQREPIALRFNRVAEQAKAMSRRLGKRTVDIEIRGDELRLEPERWRAFWSAFVHAVRNAVDHGIEPPAVRRAKDKPERGKLRFDARCVGQELVLSLTDDGHGIDWARVAERAESLGVPHDTTRDLEMALFSDGLSTTEGVTSTSGRGVGMSALLEATEALGGRICVQTELDHGTTFEFRFPAAA